MRGRLFFLAPGGARAPSPARIRCETRGISRHGRSCLASRLPTQSRFPQLTPRTMLPAGSTRGFWETRASLLAFRLNVAAWLERLGPAIFGVASAAAVTLYALRRLRGPVELGWEGFAIVAAIAALAVAWFARRRFFSKIDARVLLESSLKLDNPLPPAA